MSTLPRVKLTTSAGDITLELFAEQAPETVQNFTQYVEDGFYQDTIFHRVIDGFMIQGGGLNAEMSPKPTRDTITNEADNGISNERGTVAMARTSQPHSASAQFFINVENNQFLDHKDPSMQGWGYCVFGKVVDGMDTVDAIKQAATGNAGGMDDVPLETITITQAEMITAE